MKCCIESPQIINPITLIERGKPIGITGRIICGNNVDANAFVKLVEKKLRKDIRANGEPLQSNVESVIVPYCKTMIIELYVQFENCRISSYCVQEKKESFEQLVERTIDKLAEEFNHDGCCDEYLQDQLMIPMAFAKGKSMISCGEISLHTQTMFVILKQLLNVDIIVTKRENMNIIEVIPPV